jgi:hypothetical protein
LQEKRASQWERAVTALGSGGVTVDEFRAELGLSPDPKGGAYYLRSSALVAVPFGEAPEPPVPEPEQDEEEEQDPDQDTEEQDDGETDDEKALLPGEAKAAGDVAPDDEERRRFERELEADILTFFNGQKERIGEALDG